MAARSLGDVAEEVTLTQYRTLVVLASRGPQSLADLAEAVDVTPPTATRMCDRLIKKGLIMRRHDRGDRRLIRLTLAKKGHELVDAVTKRRRVGDRPPPGGDPVRATGSAGRLAAAPHRRCRRGTRAGLVDGVGSVDGPVSLVTVFGRTSWRATMTRASRWLGGASYLQKWLILGVLIGTMAGVGAIVFYEALLACTHFFLGTLAGYHVPTPVGEGGHTGFGVLRPTVGTPAGGRTGSTARGDPRVSIRPRSGGPRYRRGDLGGPSQSSGHPLPRRHRQDRGIGPHHRLGRLGRSRRPHRPDQRRVCFPAGPRAGSQSQPTPASPWSLGSVRGSGPSSAPRSAGRSWPPRSSTGMTSTQRHCYRASWPRLSATSSSVPWWASRPIFGFAGSYHFTDPARLPWFALIGVLGGLIGLLYAKSFYGIADLFGRMDRPRWIKPAIGGVIVGLIALAIPEVLGTGYGWIQQGLGRQLLTLPLWIVLILPFARILATGLSIGSGGSGGIFGPGLVIGAFIGASVWRLFEPVVPSMGHNPAPYVIIGMMCCFGGISRAPLAVMLMVAEMTGSLSILGPAMIAVGLAWFIVRRSDDTIYRSQLNREPTPQPSGS